MKQQIINYISAGYPALYLLTHEETRAKRLLKEVAEALEFDYFLWTPDDIYHNILTGEDFTEQDEEQALELIAAHRNNAIFAMPDFHVQMESEASARLIRLFKNLFDNSAEYIKTVIFIGCRKVVPPELEKLVTVVDLPLPEKPDIKSLSTTLCRENGIELPDESTMESVASSCLGLTFSEIENALANSIIQRKQLDPQILLHEKGLTLKNNGLLEVVESGLNLDDVGGLDVLKAWIIQRRLAFSDRARDAGLPEPKGILNVGPPGTGKSLTAKVVGNVLGVPTLRLDMGKIFGGVVGKSEENIRTAIAVAESISPCVLWIDEIEKGMSGSQSSGQTDGGTTARVFGSFLTWMQDKTKPVFVVATANNIRALPPEFLRKGRFDEIFFVDLPNQVELEAIWSIQLRKYREDPDKFSLTELALAKDNLTGSEIEQLVIEAKYKALSVNESLTQDHLEEVVMTCKPIAETMKTQIDDMRDWARPRIRLATSEIPKSTASMSTGRKLVIS